MVRHKNPPVVHNWGRKTVVWRSSSRPRTSQGYRNLITVESIADVVVLVTQSGLKDVNKLLKLDPSNTELVAYKQEKTV